MSNYSDYRSGNIVELTSPKYNGYTGKIGVIVSITPGEYDEGDIYSLNIKNQFNQVKTIPNINKDDIQPIVLNEKILNNIGFNKIDENIFLCSGISIYVISYSFISKPNIATLDNGYYIAIKPIVFSKNEEEIVSNPIRVDFIHFLQNYLADNLEQSQLKIGVGLFEILTQ